ncbi:hypothetical protein FXO38_00621 [Capsicum annuum]|nr:hypothetical protein FXO38_00621 [Capsicum annuum]
MIPSTFSADSPSMASSSTFSPSSSADGDGDFNYNVAWYGNIQYLLNISVVEALTCVLIFIFSKLRSDHRRTLGPTVIASKLLTAWHAIGVEITRHYDADAAQYQIQLMSSSITAHPPADSPLLIIV